MKKIVPRKLIAINGKRTGKLLEKENKLFYTCVGKYFNAKMETYVNKTKTDKVDIDSCFESMLQFFKDGALKANIEDANNFSIFYEEKKDNIIVFQMREGKQLLKK
jgi:hypothetical protein